MRTRAVVGLVLTMAGACRTTATLGNAPGSPDPADYGTAVRRGYAEVRAATASFHDLEKAAAAGYPTEVPRCIGNGESGAMGYHHLNQRYLSRTLDVTKPQILLYERDKDGKYILNGVEWVVPYRLWPRDTVPPKIMGRTLVRSDPLQLWYLHMWAWKPNPAGLFADWNPSVHCHP